MKPPTFAELDAPIRRPVRDYAIGMIGAGGIVRTSHLPAYRERGWTVAHVSSRTIENARAVANEFGIAKASADWRAVIDDPAVEVVDVSVPTHLNEQVCLAAFEAGKPVLVQKPIALDLAAARRIVDAAAAHGVPLAVNQNGRWDPAIRALKTLIAHGTFGQLVTASMELRTRQPWQEFWEWPEYERLMLVGMSIHHLDQFRYLFGDPIEVTAVTSTYPGQPWKGDSIAFYSLRFAGGLIAVGLDDGFPWTRDWSVTYRVEGIDAIARGSIGWPTGGYSTLEYTTSANPDAWLKPAFTTKWFPDAFGGTMGALFDYVTTGIQPETSGRNNLGTMRMVEACYRSAAERRTVTLEEID